MSGGSSSASALPPQAQASRIEVLGPAGLERLVPEWESLAAQAAEPNPLYEPWMLRPALESFGGARASCVAVFLDGALAGFFPFERLARYRGLPMKVLRSWRHRHCLLGTPLVRADAAAECLGALFAWAREAGVAAIEFDYVAADGPFQVALLRALQAAGLPSLPMDGYARALLRKAPDAASYIEGALSAQFRKQLRRLSRRLAEHGRVESRALAADGDAAAWMREFMALEAAGWKGGRGSALACRAEDARFACAVFAEAHRRGRLIAIGLDVNGKPAARMCGFLAGEGAFYFKTAYDESLERFSPGILLELELIARLHELPGVKWADSFTACGPSVMDRLWKDGRAIHRVAVGLTLPGRLAVSLLPLLRTLKQELARKPLSAAEQTS